MDRRSFIIGTTSTVGALLLSDRDNRSDALERLQRALVRPVLDASSLDYLDQRFADYWHDYHTARLPASELLAYALDDLHKVTCLLERSASTSAQLRLCTIAARASTVVGALLWDTGAYAKSRDYLHMSILAARDAGDQSMEAVAYAWTTFAWMCDSPTVTTWHTALQSIRAARDMASTEGALASWLAAIEAEVLANLGDHSACRQALHDARQATDLTTSNPDWNWTRYDQSGLAGYHGVCQLRLNAPHDAQPLLRQAIAGLDPSEGQRRLTLLIDLAEACAAGNAIDEACIHTRDAFRMSAGAKSLVKMQRLQPLQLELAGHRDTVAVRDLEEELMLDIPSGDER
jgi:hypothetical protein